VTAVSDALAVFILPRHGDGGQEVAPKVASTLAPLERPPEPAAFLRPRTYELWPPCSGANRAEFRFFSDEACRALDLD